MPFFSYPFTRHPRATGAVRSHAGLVLLALLLVSALLGAFHHVVDAAVQRGEARRVAAALVAQTRWYCSGLRVQQARSACLLRMKEGPGGFETLRAQTGMTGAPIE